MRPLLAAALAWHEAGFAGIPIRTDGSKSPAIAWKQYQDTRPTVEQLHAWFANDTYDGIGIICGAVSGHLELLELEGRAVTEGIPAALTQLLRDNGLTALWDRLNQGYLERTPSGGMHWLYRLQDGTARRNLKLARRPATAAELADNPDDRVKVLIETRGEAGQVVVAPSAGRTHPTGAAWTLLVGGPATIPTITVDERDALHAVAAMLDQLPAEDPTPRPAAGSSAGSDTGTRPGDDYNARATWPEILEPHGWQASKRFARGLGWTRPGKNTRDGISATTGTSEHGDNLYVFSSSTVFETEKPISKFAAYAMLEHNGDYGAAARALRSAGYGKEPAQHVASIESLVAPTPADRHLRLVAPVDGANALAPAPIPVAPAQTLERSEDGHAQALIAAHGHEIRYCPQRNRWLAWDGRRWQFQEDKDGGIVREYAKQVARALPETDPGAVSHKRKALSSAGTSGALRQARTDARIAVNLTDLDAHPWELNTPAGIVDLRTGQLLPSDPEKLHTRMTLCAPDATADPSRWRDFLTDTFGADHELVAYLARLVGYSAIGMVGAHVLPFAHGSGGNGKGVFLEAIQKVLGDYATSAPSGFLMSTTHARHETDIARLSGARFVVCSEVNEDDRFDEAKVKLLTGGDTITARFMQQDHFTFTPTHHLWLAGNNKPAVRSGGRSFWRRLRLIPFAHEVAAEKMVDDLQGILATDHGPAVMAWIVRGAAEYARHGLADPETVRVATADYAHDQDTVSRFLEERCIIGGGDQVQLKVATVRTAYERWCLDAGEHPVTAKAFGIALQRVGIESKRSRSARFYLGLTLVDDDENASPAPGEEWFR